MNNTESQALRNYTKYETEQSKTSATELIKKATRPIITTKNMEAYSEIYPDDPRYSQKQINRDINYVDKRKNSFKNYDIIAHTIEYMVGNWLDSDKIFDNNADIESPKAARSSDYDDFYNGVDIHKTWKLPDEDIQRCKTKSLTLAIDVTTSSKKEIIYNNQGITPGGKMAQFPNGLPYGFTPIKYFAVKNPTDNKITTSRTKTCVPRFVIGLDRDTVSYMLRNNEITENLDQDTPTAVLTRFKVLSEIRNQAKLYLEKLPDEEQFRAQHARLETILDRTQKPMYECAESMIPYPIESSIKSEFFTPSYEIKNKALSETETNILKKTSPRGEDAVESISKFIMDENSSRYDASYSAIQKGIEEFRNDNPEACQPKIRTSKKISKST